MFNRFTRREFVQLVSASALPLSAGTQDPAGEKTPASAERVFNRDWPVLTTYEDEYLSRIALPLGGIGTGVVSLGGRGNLHDWEIVNRPAKRFTPDFSFFALFARPAGGQPVTRVLEGPVPLEYYEGGFGARIANHGLPRFARARFAAAYPFGQVELYDPDVPIEVRLEAFNPLIPADADASGLPVAALRYVLTNPTGTPVSVSVCGSLRNFIGTDGSRGKSSKNSNRYRESDGIRGLFLSSDGVPVTAEQWGTMALVTTSPGTTSYLTAWPEAIGWSTHVTDFWDDFSAEGTLSNTETPPANDTPIGSLAVQAEIPPGETRSITFLLAWHFPNRRTWTPLEKEPDAEIPADDPDTIGNYYTARFEDAWAAAMAAASALPDLEARTLAFVRSFCSSDLPDVVKEAALYNLSTLRSQTVFRTRDGRFFGWEGCSDNDGCCHGSCTHVWNYEQATAFLFGDLALKMREVEFGHATEDNGMMAFRVHLPLERARAFGKAAADGQMGTIMKIYRDWQLSGDETFLKTHWPNVKKALSFAWIKGGWDADQDGVMEGAQHNTMDVEYYGPNPQMQVWYLGALRAAEEMARHLDDGAFATKCRTLFEQGRAYADKELFNGEYYEHQIRPPMEASNVAPALLVGMGSSDLTSPDFQLGRACLVDQLVGQYMAHICGLGYLVDPGHARTTLQHIKRYNFLPRFTEHFNNMRSFVLGEEAGLLMASYPHGERPKRPFPYYNEVMTGFEYTAAVHMLYEGLSDDALECIRATRDRYDGRKRSPFNEAECGHHYARAMASWAAVLAMTGFHFSAVDQVVTFAHSPTPVRWFWSNGHAWGMCYQQPGAGQTEVELAVQQGTLKLKSVRLAGYGAADTAKPAVIEAGQSKRFTVVKKG